MIKKYIMYLFRWQTSGIIIAPCIMFLPYNAVVKTIIGNLLGGLVFFWVDKWIFSKKKKGNKNDEKTFKNI